MLSRRAVELLVKKAFDKKLSECHLKDGSVEDVEMGLCLEAVGVSAGDTRAPDGRPRFLPLSPLSLLTDIMDKDFWYNKYAFYGPPKVGEGCCSDDPISFHYIEPDLMYFIDWLLYKVKTD